jgi:hypothetical protein
MCKVFLGVLAGAVDNEVLGAISAFLDFTVYAQYHTHTDYTLEKMQTSLDNFITKREAFVHLRV